MFNKIVIALMSIEKRKFNYEIAIIHLAVAPQIAVILSGTVFFN